MVKVTWMWNICKELSNEFSFYSAILEAPFTSISEVAQNHYWYLPAKWQQ